MNVNVFNILKAVYGVSAAAFPTPPIEGNGSVIASGFKGDNVSSFGAVNNTFGTPVKKITDASLGQYTFMPVWIDGYELPNPLIIISGEKAVVTTETVDKGSVIEKVYKRPYDISIICTLIGEGDIWPELDFKKIAEIWHHKDPKTNIEVATPHTLKCALTDYFLQPQNNFILTKIALLDTSGMENVEVIQLDGRSNIDFELELD